MVIDTTPASIFPEGVTFHIFMPRIKKRITGKHLKTSRPLFSYHKLTINRNINHFIKKR